MHDSGGQREIFHSSPSKNCSLLIVLFALLTIYGEVPYIGPISSLLYYVADGEWQLIHAAYGVLAGLVAVVIAARIAGGWFAIRIPMVIPLLWLPYMIWSLLSVSWSRFPEYSLLEWGTEIFMPFGLMVLAFVLARDKIKEDSGYRFAAFLVAILLGPFVVSGFLISERYPLDIVLFGTWFSFPLPFILVWFAQVFNGKADWRQPIVVLLIYLILSALLLSRMLWLVHLSTILLALGYFRAKSIEPRCSRGWHVFLATLIFICICSYILTANLKPPNGTVSAVASASTSDGWWRVFINSERYEIFSFWLEQANKNLMGGVGLGFELPSLAYKKFRPFRTDTWDVYATHGHNFFVNRLLQGGVVGLGSYLLGLCGLILAAFRIKAQSMSARHTYWCFWALLFILAAKNFSDDGMRDGTIVWFWMLVGATLGHMERTKGTVIQI